MMGMGGGGSVPPDPPSIVRTQRARREHSGHSTGCGEMYLGQTASARDLHRRSEVI